GVVDARDTRNLLRREKPTTNELLLEGLRRRFLVHVHGLALGHEDSGANLPHDDPQLARFPLPLLREPLANEVQRIALASGLEKAYPALAHIGHSRVGVRTHLTTVARCVLEARDLLFRQPRLTENVAGMLTLTRRCAMFCVARGDRQPHLQEGAPR